ncbi:NIPSNAP family protein [Herbiconiux sp. KACC 21604]|uniref:NIPSNAP family protein n=1 Tax=unclassified Herbiconiux TaxID=2618217 RepID=UPI001490AF7E|nr:NIPSNAP family protein [Herbiconiux sp. SALV-R1]QJU52714.1 NIPSNAP family protein [Herbiconiux sp. SALV-R1]WPO87614.1 NIPSNAP family protein [Herbiconiux sp. KACC 21604]
MIVDQRTYTARPGHLQEFVDAFQAQGLPLYTEYCGTLLGYFTSESGTLNQVVHLWGYSDAADRDTRRAALGRDPRWRAFLEVALPLLVGQESRLLKPTAFSPRFEPPVSPVGR